MAILQSRSPREKCSLGWEQASGGRGRVPRQRCANPVVAGSLYCEQHRREAWVRVTKRSEAAR